MIKEILTYVFGSFLVKAANKGTAAVKRYETKDNDADAETDEVEAPKKKSRPWNIGEVNYLKANHDSSSTQEMSDYLDRTPVAIRSKLRRMNFRPGPWEKDEDEYLVLNHSVVPAAVIAKHLSRSVDDVNERVVTLELHKEH